MNQVSPFDKYTRRYEEWFEKHPFVYDAEVRALRKLIPPTGRSLEIGVGTGRFALPLRIIYGLEPSRLMAVYARQRGIKVVRGHGERLPFRTDSFDVLLIVTTICFFADTWTALQEAARVIRPRGHLIIGMVNRTSPLGLKYVEHKEESVFYREANFYSVEEVVQMLRATGFSRFKYTQTIFHDLEQVHQREEVLEGYNMGSFIGIDAEYTGQDDNSS